MKNFYLTLGAVGFGLFLLEIGSSVLLNIRYDVNRSNAHQVFQSQMEQLPAVGNSVDVGEAAARQVNRERDHHPFFGYTGRRNGRFSNNFGFTTWQKFPSFTDPNNP